jgi:molybdopterin synthase sulfur carrier subunit
VNVTVRFVGSLRTATGKTMIVIRLKENAQLKEVIKAVAAKSPKLQKMATDSGLNDFRINNLILVNEKDISVLNGVDTMIKDGDEVVFVPVVHGG